MNSIIVCLYQSYVHVYLLNQKKESWHVYFLNQTKNRETNNSMPNMELLYLVEWLEWFIFDVQMDITKHLGKKRS